MEREDAPGRKTGIKNDKNYRFFILFLDVWGLTIIVLCAIPIAGELIMAGEYMPDLVLVEEIGPDQMIPNESVKRKGKGKIRAEEVDKRRVLQELEDGEQFRISGGSLCGRVSEIKIGKADENIQIKVSGNRSVREFHISHVLSTGFEGRVFDIIAKLGGSEKEFQITIFSKSKVGYIKRHIPRF